MQLRRLPVTVAGHPLDILQTKLGSEGTFLLSSPWRSRSMGRSDVRNLAKLNLGFLVSCVLQLTNLVHRLQRSNRGDGWLCVDIIGYAALQVYKVISTWRSPSALAWMEYVGLPALDGEATAYL